MAPELSSNWKKLQSQIAKESTRQASQEVPSKKRKPGEESPRPAKKQKTVKLPNPRTTGNYKIQTEQETSDMGGVQSSHVNETPSAPSASLALWAEDNEVSPEDLAEAYGLGVKNNALLDSPDNVNGGLSENVQLGKYIAIDCEMVGIGHGGYESALARISFVDYHGNQVYDSYVRPRERVIDWRTPISGISQKHMRFARDFDEVQQQAAELLQDRILIGHDVKHDLNALELQHPPSKIRDTSSLSAFRKYATGRKPALRTLAQEILKVEIQAGAHSSIEDARVAMLLFRRFKSAFDTEYGNRFPPPNVPSKGSSSKQKGKKSKKKGKS